MRVAFRSLLFVLVALLVPALGLWAGGQRDESMDNARAAFVARDYDAALQHLASAIRNDPERIEEAEALIREIRRIRSARNEKFRDLNELIKSLDVAAVETATADAERAFALIRELEAELPDLTAPNRGEIRERSLLLDYRGKVVEGVYNSRRNDVLIQARARIAAGDYWGAVDLYRAGLEIGRDDLEAAVVAPDASQGISAEAAADLTAQIARIRGDVFGETARFGRSVDAFITAADDLRRSYELLRTAIGAADTEGSAAARGAYAAALRTTADLLTRTNEFENFIEVQYESAAYREYRRLIYRTTAGAGAEQLNDRYLYENGMRRLLVGNPSQNPDDATSNLVLALRALSRTHQAGLVEPANAGAAELYRRGLAAFDAGRQAEAGREFAAVTGFAAEVENVLAVFGELRAEPVLAAGLHRLFGGAGQTLNALTDLTGRTLAVAAPSQESAATLGPLIRTIRQVRAEVEKQLADWNAFAIPEAGRSRPDTTAAAAQVVKSDVDTRLAAALEAAALKELAFQDARSRVEYDEIVQEWSAVTDRLAAAEREFQGHPDPLVPGGLRRYPEEALQILETRDRVLSRLPAAKERAAAYARDIGEIVTELRGILPTSPSIAAMSTRLSGLETTVARRTDEAIARSQSLLAAARQSVAAAMREWQDYLRSFQLIRTDLERVRAEILAAPELADVPDNRLETWQTNLVRLRDRSRTEVESRADAALTLNYSDTNVVAVTDNRNTLYGLLEASVRQIVDAIARRSRELYNTYRYEEAVANQDRIDPLVRAFAPEAAAIEAAPFKPLFYAYANISREIEVAVSTVATRTIKETSPQAKEFTQLKNNVEKHYRDAKVSLADQRLADYDRSVRDARRELKVLSETFPNNDEAAFLSLQLEMLDNEREGRVSADFFASRVTASLNTIRSADRAEADKQSALMQLRALQRLDPRFPGIARAVSDGQFILQFKRPVPTAAEERDSRALTTSAARTLDDSRATDVQLTQALANLRRAIGLDPRNTEAPALAARIDQTIRGQVPTRELPPDLDREYREASRLFAAGNLLQARLIINRVVATIRGKNYPPAQDLKERIDSRL